MKHLIIRKHCDGPCGKAGSIDGAIEEARRLASKEPGTAFLIYAPVFLVESDIPMIRETNLLVKSALDKMRRE